MLPTFMTPEIFALEYIRKKFHCDILHFSKDKQTITFNFPREVGTFGIKSRTTLILVDNILKDMDLGKDTKCKYDPHGIISSLKRTKKGKQYPHERNEVLEKVENKKTWEEVIIILHATKGEGKNNTQHQQTKYLVNIEELAQKSKNLEKPCSKHIPNTRQLEVGVTSSNLEVITDMEIDT